MKWVIKVIGWGAVNYAARFAVGGILIFGLGLNPVGIQFGLIITLTALVATYFLMRFLMRPQTTKEALTMGSIWVGFVFILDILTLVIILKEVTAAYLLSEIQTWTRLLVIVAVAPFTVRKKMVL